MKTRALFFTMVGLIILLWGGAESGMGQSANVTLYGRLNLASWGLPIPDNYPHKINEVEKTTYYAGYGLVSGSVKHDDYTLTVFNRMTGGIDTQFSFRGDGNETARDALLGTAFRAGMGKMGLFLNWTGKSMDVDGPQHAILPGGVSETNRFDLDKDLNNFSLSGIYGRTLGGYKVGTQVELAYRHEENKSFFNETLTGTVIENWIFGPRNSKLNLAPFAGLPYDSRYWETTVKASAGVTSDRVPLEVDVVGQGGFIWGGDNQLGFNFSTPSIPGSAKMDGDVKGWQVGGDLLGRYLPKNAFSYPFGITMGYKTKTRDGDGPGVGGFQGGVFDYNHKNTRFSVEAGGGLDWKTPISIRVGAGAFYRYTNEKNDSTARQFTNPSSFVESDLKDYPDYTEHRITGKLWAKKGVSPWVSLDISFEGFYGWVDEEFSGRVNFSNMSSLTQITPLDGHTWGGQATLGSTVKCHRLTFDPVLTLGYRKVDLGGKTGSQIITSGPSTFSQPITMDKKGEEVYGGFGIVIKF